MEYRKLRGGLEVSAIGVGCLAMTGGYGPVDEDECVATIQRALDLGVTLLDTADFYGGGATEELVGKALAGRRHLAVIATRGGVRSERPGGPPVIVDGDPVSLRRACDGSLQRLGVERVDLYYLARVDPKVPVEDSVGALAELVEAGKVGHIGLSEASPEELRRADAVHPVAALESEYSLWERHVEAEVLPAARELGVALVAHTPLGKGMLTGTVRGVEEFGPRDYRRNHPRFSAENLPHNRALVEEARRIADRAGTSLARLALAWLLAQGDDIVPIPGTRRRAHLVENVAALSVELSRADLDRLAAVFEPDRVAGTRHRSA